MATIKKQEKLEDSAEGEGECGDEVEVLLVRDTNFGYMSVKKLAKPAREVPVCEIVRYGDKDLR